MITKPSQGYFHKVVCGKWRNIQNRNQVWFSITFCFGFTISFHCSHHYYSWKSTNELVIVFYVNSCTSSSQVVGNATATIFVAKIIVKDWQSTWIHLYLLNSNFLLKWFRQTYRIRKHTFKAKHLWVYEIGSWFIEIPILFLSFFAADISKRALKGSSLVKLSLSKLSFLVNTQSKITRGGFYHVYGSTKRFKIVNDITEAISVAPIDGHDW